MRGIGGPKAKRPRAAEIAPSGPHACLWCGFKSSRPKFCRDSHRWAYHRAQKTGKAVAEAVAAERKRCADIVRWYYNASPTLFRQALGDVLSGRSR